MSTVTPEFLEQYHYILNLIHETAAQSKAEFEEQHRKSREDWDRRMAESKAEWEERHRKYKEEKAEEDRKYKEEQKERDKKWAEEDRKYKEEQKKLDRRMGLQEDRYGKFVESFVRNQLIRLLNAREIPVSHILSNIECRWSDGRKREFDAIAVNGDCIVVVEVKSTMSDNDVKYFLDKMKGVRERFREYHDKKILGAMAFIHTLQGAEEQAQDAGFLTILATASSASITNQEGFKPMEF